MLRDVAEKEVFLFFVNTRVFMGLCEKKNCNRCDRQTNRQKILINSNKIKVSERYNFHLYKVKIYEDFVQSTKKISIKNAVTDKHSQAFEKKPYIPWGLQCESYRVPNMSP